MNAYLAIEPTRFDLIVGDWFLNKVDKLLDVSLLRTCIVA